MIHTKNPAPMMMGAGFLNWIRPDGPPTFCTRSSRRSCEGRKLLFCSGAVAVPQGGHGQDPRDLQTAEIILSALEGILQPSGVDALAGKTVQVLLMDLQAHRQIVGQLRFLQPAGIDDLLQRSDGLSRALRIALAQIIACPVGSVQALNRQIVRRGLWGKGLDGLVESSRCRIAIGQIAAANCSIAALHAVWKALIMSQELLRVQLHVQIAQIPGILHTRQDIAQNPGRKVSDTQHQRRRDDGHDDMVIPIPEPDDNGNGH